MQVVSTQRDVGERMRVKVDARLRKAALLCSIATVHLLLIWNIDAGDGPGSHRAGEAPGILFFIEVPESAAAPSAARDPWQPRLTIIEPRLGSEASNRGDATLLAESSVDWNAEAGRVAGDVAEQSSAKEKYRPLDRLPPGMGPPPPKSSRRQFGDTQRFEGGEIITWINERCYYTSRNYGSAGLASGSDLQLQRPVCKAAASAEPQLTFEEWRKKKGDR